jgi:lipoate-protein ligase A
MYALVLDRRTRPELRGVDTTHRWVLETLAAAIGRHVPGVVRRGISDLAVRERKFSGNSLRVRRDWLLYHGTLLYSFPLRLLDACLGAPPRQPAYRAGRRHSHFVINLPLDAKTLRETVRSAFDGNEPLTTWPQELTTKLAQEKFGTADWAYRL